MSSTIAARIPEDIAREIDFLVEEENTDKSKVIRNLLAEAVKKKRLELALEKYRERKVSLGRAAELAKMPLADFMMQAASKKIPLNYSTESLKKDFLTATK